MKFRRFTIHSVCLGITSSLLLAWVVQAADPPRDVTGKEFETWVMQQRIKAEGKKAEPTFTEQVLQRMKADKSLTDETVLQAVTAWSAYEQETAIAQARGGDVKIDFAQSHKFLDRLQDYAAERPFLRARLLQKRAFFYQTSGEREKAAQTLGEAVPILDQLRLTVDKDRITAINDLADTLRVIGKAKEADPLYLEVMSYPWFNLYREPEALQYLRGQYVRAGRGVIECRRANVGALKELVFVPATEEELKPVLERAILENAK